MSLAPDVRTPADLNPDLAPAPAGSLLGPAPGANGAAHRALPGKAGRKGWGPLIAAVLGFAALAGGVAAFVLNRPPAARPDVLTHRVARGDLKVTVTEKGTLESAQNVDIICKVKAGSKGQGGYATSINWVIDDGAKVEPGQLLMILDDSALQEQYRTQKITADKAYAAKVKAEKDYEIQVKDNERLISEAENALLVAEIDLEKYTGLAADPARAPLAAAAGAPFLLAEGGEFRQKVDDLTGKVRLEESNVEQYQERTAWADRMAKQKYLSDAQAQAERSKLESARENLRSLQKQLDILQTYDRRKTLADLRSKVENAGRVVAQKRLEAEGKQVQADITRKTETSVYLQEMEKLKEIEDQLRECRIYAPQRGMVVYFVNESGRFGSQPQGMIEQGAQVKEGQKMLRLPNLEQMQVNTKVHEAMVGRIRGDVRVATGLIDQMRVGLMANPDGFTRLVSQHEDYLDDVKNMFRDHEYVTKAPGQRATVRVDAMPDQVLPARVKSVAGVASQADSWISDVKLYQTLVLIEKEVPGLKPGMTAEVTIHVDGLADVLTIPLQAVVGGAEMGAKRQVFVKTAGGYEEREVTLGLYNDRVVEVKEGLAEGDEVVINPKVLMGDSKAKTRDGGGDGPGDAGGKGPGGEGGWKGGAGKGGFDPSKMKGGFDPSKMKGMKGGGGGPPGGGPPAG
jgi:multidrug efflux pump subunit AcrA (membrane-fusion protein)